MHLKIILMNVFSNENNWFFHKQNFVFIQCINLSIYILQIFFALMLTPLFKKSKHVGIVEFLVTVAFGFVGLLIVLMESFPKSLVWLFSPFCQCTFLIGIAQVGNIFILLSLNIFSLQLCVACYTTMHTTLDLQRNFKMSTCERNAT